MNHNTGSVEYIVVWWDADCGATHIEKNPTTIPLQCPDGLTGWAAESTEAE